MFDLPSQTIFILKEIIKIDNTLIQVSLLDEDTNTIISAFLFTKDSNKYLSWIDNKVQCSFRFETVNNLSGQVVINNLTIIDVIQTVEANTIPKLIGSSGTLNIEGCSIKDTINHIPTTHTLLLVNTEYKESAKARWYELTFLDFHRNTIIGKWFMDTTIDDLSSYVNRILKVDIHITQYGYQVTRLSLSDKLDIIQLYDSDYVTAKEMATNYFTNNKYINYSIAVSIINELFNSISFEKDKGWIVYKLATQLNILTALYNSILEFDKDLVAVGILLNYTGELEDTLAGYSSSAKRIMYISKKKIKISDVPYLNLYTDERSIYEKERNIFKTIIEMSDKVI